MRQSTLFTKATKESPRDEMSTNARILIQAGFIDKLGAGIYTYLPLGLRVLKKIEQIIREEMDRIGGQELLMPSLNPRQNWEVTDRWNNFDALFKLRGVDGKDYTLAPTHEEVVVPLAQKHVFSHKELPFYVYQIQNKFRNEKRAKSGILRGREFIMKDMYSFHVDEEDLNGFYKIAQKAYFKIWERCGIIDKTYLTYAAGGTFSKYSHEFQTVTPAGEDEILICDECDLAINKDISKEMGHKCPNCESKNLQENKAIEVGNIFKLGIGFSEPFNYKYIDEAGKKKPVWMGCYGIGLGRAMGAIVEVCHDGKGLVWPKEIAPYTVHLISVHSTNIEANNKIKLTSEKIYRDLQKNRIDVIFDDREEDISVGEKFAEADLIGCPIRLVVSERSLNEDSVEVKRRDSEKKELVKIKDVVKSA